jgi:protein TonB
LWQQPRFARRQGGSHPIAAGLAFAWLALFTALGCGAKREREAPPMPVTVDVLADTGRTQTLHVVPPARVWITRVASSRATTPPVEPTPARGPAGPLPTPEPDAIPPAEPEPPLAVEGNLVPPRFVSGEPLRVPGHSGGLTVELDVHVDETGRVSDVQWASGSRDTALVRAATECAAAMHFRPATRGGRPVEVWCRQRFDFGGTRARETGP